MARVPGCRGGGGPHWGSPRCGPPGEPPIEEPWRAQTALGLPDWLVVRGSFDARYESLDKRLRAGENGSNQGLFVRTLLSMTVRDTFLEASAEIIDARVFGEPDDARTTTGQVDTAELLQGYIAGRFGDAFGKGDQLRVQLGRHTMDVGSRRLVARNVFRNTINAFTGVNAQWASAGGAKVRAFYTFPVQRLPGNGDIPLLQDGTPEFDEERSAVRFWGLHAALPEALAGGDFEAYLLGLDESDASDLATSDRDLNTIGARWLKKPAAGDMHWELESAFQFGESSAGSGATELLDHRAYLHHATLGYTFPGEESVRLEGLFDIASGDRDPGDGNNERFDSLFGIPRNDFGPTGIFREIARANVVSPGVRALFSPRPRWDVMATLRFNYLASDRDAWTTTGIVDPAGNSGSHIGDLSEVRIRYQLVPDSVRLEFGAAYHAAGSFAKEAPNGNGGRDALYGYVQTTFWF